MSAPEQTGLDAPRGRRWDDRFTSLSLGRLEMNESAVVLGLVSCLVLFSLALASDIAYGLGFLYAFSIGLSAWFFGRWVGAATGAFAVVSSVTVAAVMRHSPGKVVIVVLALLLATLILIVATEWIRRSVRLVRLLNQRELRHRQMIDTMTKVGQELVASKRWEVIADYMMSSLVRDLGLDAAWMFHRDTSGPETRLVLLASAGDAPAIASVGPGGGAPGWVLRNGRMVLARSRRELLEREPDLELTALEELIEAIVALPVVVKGATAGVVMLGSRRPRAWRNEEVGIAGALVNQLGLAMENASAYRATIEALVRLEEINQLRSDLLKTVSHELRTPMTVLAGYFDMMRDGTLGAVPENWVKPLEHVTAKVEELNRVVQMMLDASRAEGPTMQVSLGAVDVGAAVSVAVAAQQGQAEKAARDLRMEMPRQETVALADRDKLLVVMRNLIENAIKYSAEGTVVDIGLAADSELVRVWVADRGMGITDEDKPRVFDQFHRIERPETRGIGGTGLGLFIVKQLVDVQGGRVTVEDRPGGGSVFAVALPRYAEAPPGKGKGVEPATRQGVLRPSD
jgi:signal transduction histidine kinase